jgi:protein TonB
VDALYQLSDSGGDADPENEVHELTQPTRVSVVNPDYPDELRERGIKGEAMIDFVVTRSGDVVQAKVVHATHPLFGEAAAKAVTQWKFNPGKVGTRRVNTRMQQPVTFSLEEEISPIAPTQVRVEAGNNED